MGVTTLCCIQLLVDLRQCEFQKTVEAKSNEQNEIKHKSQQQQQTDISQQQG